MSTQPPIAESELTRLVMAAALESMNIFPLSQFEAEANQQMVIFAAEELRQSCDGCFHFPPRVADSSDIYSGFKCAAEQSCRSGGYCHLWQPL